jgi:hypothetical protein
LNEQRGQQDAAPDNRVPQSAEDPRTGTSQANPSQASASQTNTSQPLASDPRIGTADPAAGGPAAAPVAGSPVSESPATGTTGAESPAAKTAATAASGAPATGETKPGATKPGAKNEAVLGNFTVRDLTVFASTLILFVASLIPMFAGRYNLWNMGSLFFLGLGVILPLIVTALFVARRLTPGSKVRIGSLSVDQFASVTASFTLAFFFLAIAGDFAPSLLVGLIGSVGLFAATVLARLIPYFAGDFLDRREEPAHVVARESAAPVRKPHVAKEPKPAREPKQAKEALARILPGRGPRTTTDSPSARPSAARGSTAGATAVPGPAATGPAFGGAAAGAAAAAAYPTAAEQTQAAAVVPSSAAEETRTSAMPTTRSTAGATAVPGPAAATPATTVNPQVRSQEPIGATVDPAHRPEQDEDQPVQEAFWFAVAQPRTAFDEATGAPAFIIEPGGWVLALEDRGNEFLVQHTDGRLGVLRDLSNIERG